MMLTRKIREAVFSREVFFSLAFTEQFSLASLHKNIGERENNYLTDFFQEGKSVIWIGDGEEPFGFRD
jgi:hypothetical protein